MIYIVKIQYSIEQHNLYVSDLLKRAKIGVWVCCLLFIVMNITNAIAVSLVAVAFFIGVVEFWIILQFLSRKRDMRVFGSMLIILSGVLFIVLGDELGLMIRLIYTIQYYSVLFFSFFLLILLCRKKLNSFEY